MTFGGLIDIDVRCRLGSCLYRFEMILGHMRLIWESIPIHMSPWGMLSSRFVPCNVEFLHMYVLFLNLPSMFEDVFYHLCEPARLTSLSSNPVAPLI